MTSLLNYNYFYCYFLLHHGCVEPFGHLHSCACVYGALDHAYKTQQKTTLIVSMYYNACGYYIKSRLRHANKTL